MRASTAIAILCTAALTTACAHLKSTPRSDGPGRRPIVETEQNRIGFAEIVELRNSAYIASAYDIVFRIRPMYLNARTVSFTGGDGPLVYLDNIYLGGPSTLNQIDSRVVQEVRFGWGDGLVARPGRTPNARAIYVLTRR